MECLVICHDPATTESYTYRHTLSLHDALPIWFTRLRVSREFGNPEEAAAIFDEIAGEEGPFQDFAVTHEDSFASTEWRSEEHTSELQSLMRTSYAVFCLKKKKEEHNYKIS